MMHVASRVVAHSTPRPSARVLFPEPPLSVPGAVEAFLHVRPERLTPHVLYAVVEAALIVLQAGRVELVYPAPLRRLIVSEVYDAYGPVDRRRVVPSALCPVGR